SDCWSGVKSTAKAAWTAADSATSKLLDDPSLWNFGFESPTPATPQTSSDTKGTTPAPDTSKKSDGFFDGFLDMFNPFSSGDKNNKPAPANDANGDGKDEKLQRHEAWYNRAVDSVWNAVFGDGGKPKEVSKTSADGSKTTVTDGHMTRENKDGS